MVYGRFDSNIRFKNESDGRFDSRFDLNEKNDSQVPRRNICSTHCLNVDCYESFMGPNLQKFAVFDVSLRCYDGVIMHSAAYAVAS